MIDKIEGPGPSRGVTSIRELRRVVRAVGKGFAGHLGPAKESGAAGGVGGLGAIAPMMGLQEIDDALARSRRGRSRASSLLDQLEEIRLELLLGGISQGRLQQLAHMVEARRPEIDDQKLAEILDEIDLRARVELAKLGR